MARKTYTEQERREVLADVPTLGVKAAAGKHGVPPTTVQSWIDRGKGRGASEAAPTTKSATTPAGGATPTPAASAAMTPAAPTPAAGAAPAATIPAASAATAPTVSRMTTSEAPVAEKQARRQYTEEEKREAIADAATMGVCGAAKKHGTAESNVSRWCKRLAPTGTVASAERSGATVASGLASGATVASAAASSDAVEDDRREVKDDGRDVEGARAGNRKKKQVAKKYTPSQKAEAVEYAAAHGVSAASDKLGMTRFSIYDWQHKVEQAAAGLGESPTAGPAPADIEAQRDAEILAEYKRHPGLGPSQIKNQLRRKGVKVSVHTTRRVMEEAGYRPPKVKREPHDERFEAVRPNHLWHLDFVHRHINRTSTFNLILIDDYSRFVVGHGTDDAERADLVIDTFEHAVARYGRPEMVIHDKGSAFWSWRGIAKFTALLTELGIDQIEAQHKEWNGKLEVFNANLIKELFDVQRFYDVAEMKRRLSAHLWWYNHERTNHALGGLLVPADRYYGRADEVLARIEAGAGRDGLDALDLKRRTLELFKVVTEGGVPAIWLMGQKLLSLGA